MQYIEYESLLISFHFLYLLYGLLIMEGLELAG